MVDFQQTRRDEGAIALGIPFILSSRSIAGSRVGTWANKNRVSRNLTSAAPLLGLDDLPAMRDAPESHAS
jgi:hypothetical protein